MCIGFPAGGFAGLCRDLVEVRAWNQLGVVVRELGLKRRETVWSLSAVGVGSLKGAAPSTRGPEWTNLWCTGYDASRIAG